MQAIYNIVPKIDSVSATPKDSQQQQTSKEDPKEVWSLLSKQVGFKPKGDLDRITIP